MALRLLNNSKALNDGHLQFRGPTTAKGQAHPVGYVSRKDGYLSQISKGYLSRIGMEREGRGSWVRYISFSLDRFTVAAIMTLNFR